MSRDLVWIQLTQSLLREPLLSSDLPTTALCIEIAIHSLQSLLQTSTQLLRSPSGESVPLLLILSSCTEVIEFILQVKELKINYNLFFFKFLKVWC